MDYGVIFKSALEETKEFIKKTFGLNFKVILYLFLFLTGCGVYWYLVGLEEVKAELMVTLSFGLIPIVGFIALIFLANLILAPSRILYEVVNNINHKEKNAKTNKEKNYRQDDFYLSEKEFGHWEQVQELKVYEAACLWEGVQPKNGSYINRPLYKMLYEAILNKELELSPTSKEDVKGIGNLRGMDLGNQTIERKELVKFAEGKGLKPEFLFKDQKDNTPRSIFD